MSLGNPTKEALERELQQERVAHARTQGHLDDFQGTCGELGVKIIALTNEIEDLKRNKDQAYSERNKLVAFLTRLFPSTRCKTAIAGWDPEWHGCVFIQTPEGQMSWHYHDSEAALFAHVPETVWCDWDRHTTEEKYRRLEALGTSLAAGFAGIDPRR